MKEIIAVLAFEETQFAYQEEKWIFPKGITAQFKRGTLNVVTGMNGGGKSTLLNLTLGIWDDYKGKIFLDSHEISSLNKCHLRELIAYGFQIPAIMQDTIENNITLGRHADLERLEDILKEIRLWEDIIEMPDKLQSIINKNLLSQGQMQKIGIARTLYSENPVMIFDEPTSNLDAESVQAFIDLIRRVKEKFLVVIISHDERIIAHAEHRFVVVT